MGFALAAEAARRGARTVLVAGPVALATPPGVERHDVRTALEMESAVRAPRRRGRSRRDGGGGRRLPARELRGAEDQAPSRDARDRAGRESRHPRRAAGDRAARPARRLRRREPARPRTRRRASSPPRALTSWSPTTSRAATSASAPSRTRSRSSAAERRRRPSPGGRRRRSPAPSSIASRLPSPRWLLWLHPPDSEASRGAGSGRS